MNNIQPKPRVYFLYGVSEIFFMWSKVLNGNYLKKSIAFDDDVPLKNILGSIMITK